LGGKSANIISKHADLDKAVNQSAMGLFFNAGQVCIAGSRIYAHSSIHDKFVSKVV
jgi:acyl-CoA reductase-like NAD-dependent aldehyde dehydrogenase